MELRGRLVLGFVVGALSLSVYACAEPNVELAGDDKIPTKPDPKAKDDTKDKSNTTNIEQNIPVQAVEATDCTSTCTEGAKRCSATAGAGTEVCAKGLNGCFDWTQGADCGANSSCDKDKNDGTCVAGCVNDAGCSAANSGAETCTAEGGRSRIQCKKVGACFQWTTASSCSPDEACHSGTCQSVPSCTNVCTLNALRCSGARGVEQCVKATTGCTVWQSAHSCSPDETCTNGTCG